MKVEILIYADVIEDETDISIEKQKQYVVSEIGRGMKDFIKQTADYLEDVDFEESFDDMGIYDFISKKYDSEKYKAEMEFRKEAHPK